MAVLVVVGLARSGKDTVAEYIAKKYGFAKYTFSSVLSEMIEKRGEKATKERMIALGDMLRKKMGMDAVARLLGKKIVEKDNLLLVGPRSIEEIDYFRGNLLMPGLKIIEVSSQKKLRFGRKTGLDPATKKGFFMRDEKDLETKGFGKTIGIADYKLENNGTKKQLFKSIDALMKEVLE